MVRRGAARCRRRRGRRPRSCRRERREQRLLVDDRPARRVDEDRRRAHARQLGGADQPARARAQPQVDVTTSERSSSSSRATGSAPAARAASAVEVLAPREHVHRERAPDRGDARPGGRGRSRRASGRPAPSRPWSASRRPGVAASSAGMWRSSARIRPQVSSAGGLGERPGAADHDAARGRGGDVDRRVRHPRGDEQPQARQGVEHGGVEGRALPHGDDRVERREPLAERPGALDVVAEER